VGCRYCLLSKCGQRESNVNYSKQGKAWYENEYRARRRVFFCCRHDLVLRRSTLWSEAAAMYSSRFKAPCLERIIVTSTRQTLICACYSGVWLMIFSSSVRPLTFPELRIHVFTRMHTMRPTTYTTCICKIRTHFCVHNLLAVRVDILNVNLECGSPC
jgi:hypothetical protein